MKLENYPIRKLKAEISAVIGKYLDDDYRAFFFGSRIRGDNFPRADIDIGIIGPKKISASAKLNIQRDLENLPILYKIDLVDFNAVPDNFKRQALKNVEYVK